jgi:hypothetical protein
MGVEAGTWVLVTVTALLAVATFFMAFRTSALADATVEALAVAKSAAASAEQQVEAANKAAAVATKAWQASLRPVLADVPEGIYPTEAVLFDDGIDSIVGDGGDVVVLDDDSPDFAYCSVALRNIGLGTAVIRGLGLEFPGDVGWSGKMSLAVVPPGEKTRLTFTIPKDRPELAEGIRRMHAGDFTVGVRYSDVVGEADLITRVHCYRTSGPKFRVRQFFQSHADGEPFVSSGPVDP